MTKLYAYKGHKHSVIFNKLPAYSIFYHDRRISTFCCLFFDNHRQLRMPVTTFNQFLRGGACDSLPGVVRVMSLSIYTSNRVCSTFDGIAR